MKTRWTGIIRTLPYYGAGEPNESDAMRKAYKRMMAAFKAMETNEEVEVRIALSQKPTIEVLHCYILVGGKIRVRANIADIVPGYCIGETECFDGSLRNPKFWAILTSPVSWPSEPIARRGFQGFRYTQELW